MIPYIYFDLKTMLKDLLEIIVEPAVIQKCKTGKQLIEIDLEIKENLKLIKWFSILSGRNPQIVVCSRSCFKSQVSRIQKGISAACYCYRFQIDWKSPLGSDFLPSLSVLHPQFLSSHPRSTVLDRWKIALTHILKLKILSTKFCDEAMSEFKLFLDGNVMKFKEK